MDFGSDKLPIDVLRIARAAGIRVIRDSTVHDLMPGENGKAYFDGSQWVIIYNDSNPKEISRYTLAHELGHIFLGHEMTHAKYVGTHEFSHRRPSEHQADMFAQRLLCPACVLWGLGVHSAEDIASCCVVEQSTAAARSKRMRTLYKRSRFLCDQLERDVYDNFIPYIQSTASKQNAEPRIQT